MDAIIVKNKVSLLEEVRPTNLPTQPGVYTRKQRQCFSTGPPSPRRLEGLMKEALHTSLPNLSFVLQPCQQTAIFIQLRPGLPQKDTADHS